MPFICVVLYVSQTSTLQSQLASLRAEVEQGEATRQNLEYELTLAKKSTNQEKRYGSEKINELNVIVKTQRGMSLFLFWLFVYCESRLKDIFSPIRYKCHAEYIEILTKDMYTPSLFQWQWRVIFKTQS